MSWQKLMALAGIGVVLTVSGCAAGSGGQAGAAAPGGSATTVSMRNVTGVGSALVDSAGETLYFSDVESTGTVRCLDACLHFWKPLTVDQGVTPTAATGVAGTLATITRPDGPTQVTLDSKPLYTFSLDGGAGQAKGNGFTDSFDGTQFRWQAATASGAAPTASATDGNGYGY
ncbi:MAG TPA: hypothetical protein VFR11_14850 [Micromonosporaceae bacterium]|jgi:predicted lipoprotein with Yx(FWY)xxD motif|nr:hypothetical protein [Micromonosporaceae bacterium]